MVEFRDDSGSLLKQELKDYNGFTYLAIVTVTGSLRQDEAGNYFLSATALHVDEESTWGK